MPLGDIPSLKKPPPTNGPVSRTAQHVAAWYALDPRYAEELLHFFLGEHWNRAFDSVQELLAFYPEKRVQLEYAFSTNVRGTTLSRVLCDRGIAAHEGKARKYLDIGCAYGGFLTAFSRLGYQVYGVERVPELAVLARKHLDVHGLPDSVQVGDFLDHGPITAEATFDLVTCNDVIEHVADPERCLRKVYDILRPGGWAYVETANKLSLRNVVADIHFQIFGLSLLDHHRAGQMYRQLTGSPNYGVSDFYEPCWYLNLAKSLPNAEVLTLHDETLVLDYRADLNDLFGRFRSWDATHVTTLDFFLVHEVKKELFRYLARYFGALGVAHDHHNMEEFHRTYSDPLLRFAMRKKE
jgi:2-polyprenyl-3-methyl-5-hydroxy-6-metoxy-1,4-benzoquinol methylase